jgi:AraC-like DNA-binding protein
MAAPIILQWGYWPPGKRRTLAAHRNNGLEVVLVLRGLVTWQVEGHLEQVPAGSIFYTLPWEMHGSATEQEPGCELFFVVLRLEGRCDRPNGTFRFPAALGLSPPAADELRKALLAARHRAWSASPGLVSSIRDLCQELSRTDASTDVVNALARVLLIQLRRTLRGEPGRPNQLPAMRRVEQFVRRLPDECHRGWTLTTMSDACGLSRTRFSAILKHLTGDTPRMALNRARINLAKQQLRATEQSITRIALACGYSSSQYFAGVFKAYAGQSAACYRQQARVDSQARQRR